MQASSPSASSPSSVPTAARRYRRTVYGSPEQKADCGRIVARTGDMMAELLAEKDLLRS
jgi:hypothetical protein